MVCADRAFYLAGNRTLGDYRGDLKQLLWLYKFGGRRDLAAVFADMALPLMAGLTSPDLVTAVPMNRDKERQRGYNQSLLMARELGHRCAVPCVRVLREAHRAGTQRHLDLHERFLNVLGRYYLSPEAETIVGGRRVLLVDDIFTTGATLNECARLLVGAGAAEVFSITIARAPIKKLEME